MEIPQPHKIGFEGTSSVGKTTIYEWCKRTLGNQGAAVEGLALVDEAATLYFRQHTVPEHLRFTERIQGEIQAMAIDAELTVMAGTPLRPYAFSLHDRVAALSAPVYVRSTGDIEGSDRLFNLTKSLLGSYSRIYLLDPAGVPFQQNDVRTEDKDKRDQIHRVYLEFLEEKKIKYVLLSGTEEERKATVMDYLTYLGRGGVPDNVGNSPKVALRNRYASREQEVFNTMIQVFRAFRPDRDNPELDPFPIDWQHQVEELMHDLHLATEYPDQRRVSLDVRTLHSNQAFQVLFSTIGVELPNLGQLQGRVQLPTSIDGLDIDIVSANSKLELSFVFKDFRKD